MPDLAALLEKLLGEASKHLEQSYIPNATSRVRIESLCRCLSNKAPIRFLMACMLGKLSDKKVDIRKPYTEIGGKGTFSGRWFDEHFIEPFITQHKLPVNSTTAFLTPAFRNIDHALTMDYVLVGRPREVYETVLFVLDKTQRGQLEASQVLKEILRMLLIIKRENLTRMDQLLRELKHTSDSLPLSSEQTLTLLTQHLSSPNASRLPVLMVTAAYLSIADKLGETIAPLKSHNAADKQTGAIGDVEVTLVNEEEIVTCYEMKNKRVSVVDVENALHKIATLKYDIDNYIFITTDVIEEEVTTFAKSVYDTSGVEIAVLDCIGFVRHFLHFFHRYRLVFLDTYQKLVLSEPDSSIGQPLKESFLVLRKAAEADKY